MGLSLGNTSIAEIYLGSTKISEMYLGSSKVYELSKKPYFVFEFSVSGYDPTDNHNLVMSSYNPIWTQISSSPNRWKLEIPAFRNTLYMWGLEFLFCESTSTETNSRLVPSNLGGGTCKLIESGNFDITDSNGHTCQSMDRMFYKARGLTYIEPIHCTNVQNVGGMFNGCIEVTEGAYDQYVWFNTYGINITNHSGTFTNCGSNTQTGAAELAQIPVGWGGKLVPASTLMTSSVINKNSGWRITGNAPTWTNVKNGLYIFTEASVSQYAGVSMNRSRIYGYNSLYTASGNALYFYPAFLQLSSGIPNDTAGTITWLVTTNLPNGNLTTTQGKTDMPGTLDYGTYGPFAREYGTYDSSKDVYFVFFATNVPIDQWTGVTDAYGFLYNNYFKSDAKLRWFF